MSSRGRKLCPCVRGLREVGAERISRADLDQIDEATGRPMAPGTLEIGRLEFRRDQVAAAVVAQRCGEVRGRDAE